MVLAAGCGLTGSVVQAVKATQSVNPVSTFRARGGITSHFRITLDFILGTPPLTTPHCEILDVALLRQRFRSIFAARIRRKSVHEFCEIIPVQAPKLVRVDIDAPMVAPPGVQSPPNSPIPPCTH